MKYLLLKIPPRINSKGKQVAGSSDSQGTSATQSSRTRQTQNSTRAGRLTSPATNSRELSTDLSVQRVEQRIQASLDHQAARNRSTNTNPEISHTSPPDSPLTNISEMSSNAPGASTSAVSNTPAGSGGNQNIRATLNRPGPMPTRKMPKPGEKNAPTFDPDKPEELGRFFERMEDWFADEGIIDDLDKKRRIVRYLDPDSETQWKALSKFGQGTYLEFQSQVMASYPKAEEIMKGSVTALKRKIRSIGPVAQKDRDDLLSLIRIITAEVMKLKQIQPPIHTNRELVELFLARLTSDFAGIVANKLSVQRLIAQAKNNTIRNTEDMYDIDEVMEVAKETSLEYGNPFGKYLGTTSVTGSDVSVKLEEAVAKLKDTINLQVQHNKQVDQRLASMQSFMSQPRPPVAQPGYNRGLEPSQGHIMPAPNIRCFYCQGPHRIADCEHAARHLDAGWIVRISGSLRLPGGQSIPRDGGKTMKEVVEEQSKQKPGIIPISKIPDKAALYQGAGAAGSYIQSQATEDDNLRVLAELLQKVGIDRIQAMINSKAEEEVVEEENEWSENFDQAQG